MLSISEVGFQKQSVEGNAVYSDVVREREPLEEGERGEQMGQQEKARQGHGPNRSQLRFNPMRNFGSVDFTLRQRGGPFYFHISESLVACGRVNHLDEAAS